MTEKNTTKLLEVDGPGNYYGCLNLAKIGKKYYWGIESYDGVRLHKISKQLYDLIVDEHEVKERDFVGRLNIAACGANVMLTNECARGNDVWEAWKQTGRSCVRMGESGATFEVTGHSLEEAVAKLWITLQESLSVYPEEYLAEDIKSQ